uniref:Uncharacterized protein n=1 Tax=Oryza nivara TaxID=4536 RepID=A0A0E0J080_ORYNI
MEKTGKRLSASVGSLSKHRYDKVGIAAYPKKLQPGQPVGTSAPSPTHRGLATPSLLCQVRDGVVAATTSSGEDEAAMLENWVAGNGELLISVQASIIMGLQGAVSQTALQPGQPSRDVRPTVESWYFANNKLH